MGYDLIVESQEGKGSTFKIVLGQRAGKAVREPEQESLGRDGAASATDRPSAPAGVPGGAATTVGGPTLRDFKVLVVDDEKDSRDLIEHYLEEFGCHVISASGGEEGLALARQHHPDLMTLDLLMPGMTGWEVLKRMKADPALRPIPVVVVSVLAGEGRGSLLGAVDLVAKPFEREDLLRVLWRHLGRRHGGRILMVGDEAPLTEELVAFLTGRGLEVVTCPAGANLFDALATEVPDAVVLDLAAKVDMVEWLGRLRMNRLYAGLPTFVIPDGPLTPDAQVRLGELHAVVVPSEEPVAALADVLGVLFPVADEGVRKG
jgi:CheY-like chemotaxis protein